MTIMDKSLSLDPFTWYRQMQQEQPVIYDPDYTMHWGEKGLWHVFSYADVKRVLSDYDTFSSQAMPVSDDNPLSKNLVNSDPPRHTALRKIISRSFTPRVISDLEPWIRDLSYKLLEPALETGEIEFMNQFATPLPIKVILKLLGVPEGDVDKVLEWAKAITANPTAVEGGMEAFARAQQEQVVFFTNLIEERSKQPQNDLISLLLAAEADGEKLSMDDLLSFCMILLLAGNETTTNLLGNSMLTFTEYPELQEQLAQNPADIPKALTEVLRYRSPVQSLFRKVKKDVVLSGQQLKKGDKLAIWFGAANHDDRVFPNPEVFDINRDNHNNHLSFGHGIHYCLGAPLAKLEAKVAFEVIFKHIKQIQVQPDVTVKRHPSAVMYRLEQLPLTFKLTK